ncbi:hypothetical protein L0F63_003490, partial [Massospora cicadina]
ACDECRSRKIRCKVTSTSCVACDKKRAMCKFDNPILKRGPKPRNISAEKVQEPLSLPDSAFPGMPNLPSMAQASLQPKNPSEAVVNSAEEGAEALGLIPPINVVTVKADGHGCLNIATDSKGRKVAHYYICIPLGQSNHYSPVSLTSLVNHPLSYLDANSCMTHQVFGLLTSQQIYITIIFFSHIYPHYPTLDLNSFNRQLMEPITTSLLFLLNCICAVACPYSSNSKARFDKSQFYYKALEINYYYEDKQLHPNWAYGHMLLKLSKQTEANSDYCGLP